MASDQHVVDSITSKLSCAHPIETRKMFGEYAIYSNQKVVGMVCDNLLFIKITDAGQAFVGERHATGAPYPGAKQAFLIDPNSVQPRWLSELIDLTQAELPNPKKKK